MWSRSDRGTTTGVRRVAFGSAAVALLLMNMTAMWVRAGDPPVATPTWPGLDRAGSVLLPNGWSLKPAGRQTALGDMPVALAEHPTDPYLAVLHAGYGENEVVILHADSGRVVARYALPHAFAGLTWSRDGKHLYVGGGFDDVVYGFEYEAGLLSKRRTFAYPNRAEFLKEQIPGFGGQVKSQRVPAGLALGDDGRTLWVANAFSHTIARFDTAGAGKYVGEWPVGEDAYPFGVVVDDARRRVYVSLWARAEVAVIDADSGKVTARWPAQDHPNELLLARGGKILYVANANRNTVSVFDAAAGKPLETIGTAIDPQAPNGCTPSSLSLTPDESILFVANANTNDVAAVNVKEPGSSAPLGFIPSGWYPTAVRVAHDGKTLWTLNGKGGTSKANRDGPNPLVGRGGGIREYIGGLYNGTLATLRMPSAKEMAAFTKTVYECSPLRASKDRVGPAGGPIPSRVGDASPIQHVVYIIKENRTYDQVFGDLPRGNGEKALCLFPEEVTPNHHALANEFVLLDNFYVDGEVSADGHEWTMGAYASDFVERIWPLGYRGDRRVPYPAEGNMVKIARPTDGYLWDRAAAKGLTYRSYGEFVHSPEDGEGPATTKLPVLQGHFDPKFRSFDMDYPDVKRADRFLAELAEFEKKGELPRLITIHLPNDHTAGTSPGKPTPTAYVADNDLALGRIVEGLSKSKFWPKTAIFVVEDDAQNGSDHVDAHRTVALAISPYTKKGKLDSTLYSTSSMLRTIGLILGLEPLSQFDAAARPMWESFTSTPDLAPYACKPARVSLSTLNTASAWGAEASKKLDLEQEDRADDLVLNEIIWKSVKGAGSPMPPPVRAAFVLPRAKDKLAAKDDDD